MTNYLYLKTAFYEHKIHEGTQETIMPMFEVKLLSGFKYVFAAIYIFSMLAGPTYVFATTDGDKEDIVGAIADYY